MELKASSPPPELHYVSPRGIHSMELKGAYRNPTEMNHAIRSDESIQWN